MNDRRPTIDAAIRAAAARLAPSDTARLDARVLAGHVFGLDAAGLILESERALSEAEAEAFDALIARRAAGEPVAAIIGEKEFFGLTFRLAPGLLTPRPDSETLIEAASAARGGGAALRILDLGTGTGCLLLSLLTVFPAATGVGVDCNSLAARTARDNAVRLGLGARAAFFTGDWMAALSGRFDLIVSNPPYIRDGDAESLPVDVRGYEDPRALFAGADGLAAYRRILAAAPAALAPGGLIILELGAGQREAAASLAAAAFPAARIGAVPDLAGRPRALVVDLAPDFAAQK